MMQTPEHTTLQEALTDIATQIRQINESIQRQNELLEGCILQPEDKPARFMVGAYGALEVINL